MLESVIPWVRGVHIGIGTLGLLLFWIPIVTRKGGATHVRYGRAFILVCYTVLASAALSVALHMARFWQLGIGPRDAPALFSLYVFLGYLTVTTFAIVTHGRGAVFARSAPRMLCTPWRIATMVLAILGSLGLIGYALHFQPPTFWVLLAISPFGLFAGYDGLSHMFRDSATTSEWVYQHLNGMIGAGIAFYTAFGAFGARVMLDFDTLGASWLNIVPWLLPAAVGVPATLYWKRLVMRRFAAR